MAVNATGGNLDIHGIGKSYGPFKAVDGVSLQVSQGEFLTLLGPSGSGKSTLSMMIAGFTAPDAGRILLGGREITRLPPEARNFGMVFQGYALFPHLSVFENVGFPLKIRGLPREEVKRRVEGALDLVQLRTQMDRLPRQLSGGQQQRVALARSIVFTPHLLRLDEPLSALDKLLRAELQDELKRLHRKVGLTFIHVTHDQEEALSMSDRIANVWPASAAVDSPIGPVTSLSAHEGTSKGFRSPAIVRPRSSRDASIRVGMMGEGNSANKKRRKTAAFA